MMSTYEQAVTRLEAGGATFVNQYSQGACGDGLVVTENMWIETANFEASRVRNLKIPRGRGIDTVILLDISESMEGEGFAQMKEAVLEILKSIKESVFTHHGEENIAIVTFGHTTSVICHLTNNYDDVVACLDGLTTGGRSPLMAGMYMALSAIAARGTETVINGMSVHPRIILLSDGQATDSENITGSDHVNPNLSMDALNDIKNLAVRLGADHHSISCVPVGDANEDFLLMIASESGGHLDDRNRVQKIGRYFKNLTDVTVMKRKYNINTTDPQAFANVARSMVNDVTDSDIDDMLLILLETDDLSSCKSMEEEDILDPNMPLMGSRVRRGPDWSWGEQDMGGPGTIIRHCTKIGWLMVKWDLNITPGRYKHGADDKYDLRIIKEPRILTKDELIATGCLVCRGKDWTYGLQDGGQSNVGVVFDVRANGTVRVRWPNGHMNVYKYGCEGMFDVKIWHPEGRSTEPKMLSSTAPNQSANPPHPHQTSLPPRRQASRSQSQSEYKTLSPTSLTPLPQQVPPLCPQQTPPPPPEQVPPLYLQQMPPSLPLQQAATQLPLPSIPTSTPSGSSSETAEVSAPSSTEVTSHDMFTCPEEVIRDEDLFLENHATPTVKSQVNQPKLIVELKNADSFNSQSIGTPSPGTEAKQPVFVSQNVSWQYQLADGSWCPYPEDVSDRIEVDYQRNRSKTSLIHMNSKMYRITFKNGIFSQKHVDNGRNDSNTEPECPVNRIEVPLEILGMDKEKVDLYFAAIEEGVEYVTNLRIMVVGHEGVGKTTLCYHLLRDLVPENLASTNGIDIYIHRFLVNLRNQQRTKLPDREEDVACLRLKKVITDFKLEKERDVLSENLVVGSMKQPNLGNLDTPEQGNLGSMNASLSSKTVPKSIGSCGSVDELQDNRSYSSDEGYINKYRYNHSFIPRAWNNLRGADTPRNHKITEFFMNDMVGVMRMVEDEKDEGEEEEEQEKVYLSVWDFGGQKVFYDSHHIFLSTDAVYLVCFNVHDCLQDRDSKAAEFDRARFWLRSIGTLSTKQKNTKDKVQLPPIILVGTHMDKVEGETAEDKQDKFNELCTQLLNRPELERIKNHIQGYCAVDNIDPSQPWLNDLWDNIRLAAPLQSQWKFPLPARWLALERELMKLKSQGQKIMTFGEVVELSKKLESPIKEDKVIESVLEYLHQTGNILFFKDLDDMEDLKERKVVLNPQWIVHAFRCLITDTKLFKFENNNLERMWKMYHINAELLQPLVNVLWRQEGFREHKAVLLTLMEDLGLISRPKSLSNIPANEKLNHYIVPTILRESNFGWLNDVLGDRLTACSRTLCLVFEFVPFMIFHKLLAVCIGHYKVADYLQHEEPQHLLQKGFGCFIVNEQWHMILHCKNSVVKVTMFKFGEDEEDMVIKTGELTEVRKFLETNLNRILVRHQLDHLTFQYALHCKFSCGDNENLVMTDAIRQCKKAMCCGNPTRHFLKEEELAPWFAPRE